MSAYKLTIHGKVQGVWFRQFTVDASISLGVIGWVRNDREGTVSAFIQGDEHSINQLISLLKKGPDFAEVTDIKKVPAIEDNSITDFRIKH